MGIYTLNKAVGPIYLPPSHSGLPTRISPKCQAQRVFLSFQYCQLVINSPSPIPRFADRLLPMHCYPSNHKTELQLKIWQNAVPDPYSIPSVIVFIINPDVDLAQPRGYLPSAKELLVLEGEDSSEEEDSPEEEEGSDVGISAYRSRRLHLRLRQPIFNMMQTCRDARTIVQETYRLDITSAISRELSPLCKDPEDMIYFHFPQESRQENGFSLTTFVNYLAKNLLTSLHNFVNVRHVAFYFDPEVMMVLHGSRRYHQEGGWQKPILLQNFPDLESLSLFIEPFQSPGYDWTDGKLVLYPPKNDVKIHKVHMTSDEIEHQLGEVFSGGDGKWEPPIIDVYVVRNSAHKKKQGRG